MRECVTKIVEANQLYSSNSPNEYFLEPEIISKPHTERRHHHRNEIVKQLELFRRCGSQTNSGKQSFFGCFTSFRTVRNLLFERRFEGLCLFEEILQTPGMKEVIELIFELSDTLKNECILQTVRFMNLYFNYCN